MVEINAMKKSLILILLLIAFTGCRERFEGFDFQSHSEKLVIEAVLTDHTELGYIRVSYTEPVNGNEIRDFIPEEGATILVSDDQGNEFSFFSEGNGLYANPTFSPVFGRQYRMQVQVGDNRYESDWQALPSAQPPAIDVQYRPDTAQIINNVGRPMNDLTVTLSDKVVKGHENSYTYWSFVYYYIYDAYGQPDILDLLPDAKRFCYVQDTEWPRLTIHKDQFVEGRADSEYRLDVSSVPYNEKLIYDYAVHVIKYSISESIHDYFGLIAEQLDNDGGVFDAAPSSIPGNFTQVSGSLDVLGYFGVFNASEQRVFFNQSELPYRKMSLPTSAADCPGHHAVDLDNTCFNCTSVASPFNTIIKPAWWR